MSPIYVNDGSANYVEVPSSLGSIYVNNGGSWAQAEEAYCVMDDGFGNLSWEQSWSSLATPTLALDGVTALTVTVSWAAISGATAYTIYRTTTAVNTPTDSDIVTTSATSPYVASVPTASTTYYFWVRATKSAVRSLFSNRVTATTNALPTVPQSFSGTGFGDQSIGDYQADLVWSNAERLEEKTLEVFNRNTSVWDVVDSNIGEADTDYLHQFGQAEWDDWSNLSDEVQYRIKFNGESTYATTTVTFSII
jgi:hypothetical protein